MLTALTIYPDSELTAYGLTQAQAQATGLRQRIADWHRELSQDCQ